MILLDNMSINSMMSVDLENSLDCIIQFLIILCFLSYGVSFILFWTRELAKEGVDFGMNLLCLQGK